MLKRTLSVLLAIYLMAGLLVSTLPAAHAASSGSCGENARWSFDAEKGVLTISGTGTVTHSGDSWPWVSFKDQIKTVKVEYGITEISKMAFAGCDSLRSAVFADSVKVLGESVFHSCNGLQQVNLGSGMTTIKYGVFHDCSDLTSLVIPATVTFIDWPFEACVNLSKIWFLGNAPQNSEFRIYYGAETLGTTVYYPAGNSTWTPDIMKPSIITEGHDIYWKPYTPLPFADVEQDDYFFEPVLWAYNDAITEGTDASHFSPSKACTRAQVVTFLWRSAGCPKPNTTDNPFTDVAESKFYYDAVLWAVEEGITSGVSSTRFNPSGNCTRGQIVTFLYRNACPRINEPFEW